MPDLWSRSGARRGGRPAQRSAPVRGAASIDDAPSDRGGRAGRHAASARETSQRTGADSPRTTPRTRRVKRKDVILFANQLAVMVDTGVPLGQALESIGGRAADPAFADLIQTVTDSVKAGEPLSRALARHPGVFPPIMVALLRASEVSGAMGTMLNRVANYLNREQQILRQVRGALMYPTLMFTLCVSITVFLLVYILPKFALIYEARRATLPGPTRLLLGISNELVTHWPWWLAGTAAAAVFAFLWQRTGLGRRQADWLRLNVPVASRIFQSLYISRGCRTLGTMIESGVPLLDSISIVRDVTKNDYYDRLWDAVDENLRRGQPLSMALFASSVIPDHVAQMIESGEQAGRMGGVFSRVADFAESEFDQAVKTTTQMIEPVMILVMGTVIGFIAIALLIPIFSISRVVSG